MDKAEKVDNIVRQVTGAIIKTTAKVAFIVFVLTFAGVLVGYYSYSFLTSAGWFALPMILSVDLLYVAVLLGGLAFIFAEVYKVVLEVKKIVKRGGQL
ncbi:hypothetical protein [Enterococcus phage MDA2]|uniref:Uncharacterized protein n=1 Tax=Enterococcus phage MDA2 TaxID=2816459 RepID=A0AAE7RMS2_9CAUD|nr:hypothetical protein [Enterococcus phage MDA2]